MNLLKHLQFTLNSVFEPYIFLLSYFLPGLGGTLAYPMLYEPEHVVPGSGNLDEL